jgi:hypothetical protein
VWHYTAVAFWLLVRFWYLCWALGTSDFLIPSCLWWRLVTWISATYKWRSIRIIIQKSEGVLGSPIQPHIQCLSWREDLLW